MRPRPELVWKYFLQLIRHFGSVTYQWFDTTMFKVPRQNRCSIKTCHDEMYLAIIDSQHTRECRDPSDLISMSISPSFQSILVIFCPRGRFAAKLTTKSTEVVFSSNHVKIALNPFRTFSNGIMPYVIYCNKISAVVYLDMSVMIFVLL